MDKRQQTFTLKQMRENDQLVSFGTSANNVVGQDSHMKTRVPRGIDQPATQTYGAMQANVANGLNTAEAFAQANIMQERDLNEFDEEKESQFTEVDKVYGDIEDFEDRIAQQQRAAAGLVGPSAQYPHKPQFRLTDVYAQGFANPMLSSKI